MKKNAIALAIGALCIAPAAHAQIVFGNDAIGTVQFYGKFYPQVTSGTSSGATAATDTVSTLAKKPTGTTAGGGLSVDANNSYLGFRGERKFGSTGLKGIWQIEQALDFDTGGGTFANRDSFLGLAGGFGTVKLGRIRTIYRQYGPVVGILGLSAGNFVTSSTVLSKNAATGKGSFHLRQSNSIRYESPELSGFQLGAQYSPDETKGTPGQVNNAELWSFGVKYEAGPMYVSLQHEIHKDFFGGSSGSAVAPGTHSKDQGTRLSAVYKLGKQHKLAADIAQIRYSDSGAPVGGFDEYKRVSWDVGVESKWGGPWRTSFTYTQSQAGTCTLVGGATCSTDGLKVQQFAAGLAYDLDKQTFLYLIGAKLINGKSAILDSFNRNVTVGRGADITQVAVGMSYRF